MANFKQKKEDAMAKVNSILTALNLYPDGDTIGTSLSLNVSANPIQMLVDFFKSTKGYDWLINAISTFISESLPALEMGVKGVLLSNIQVMLSCSLKPIITEKTIKEGVVFDLNKIDLFNIFKYSPLNKDPKNPGRFYYFGCDTEDGIETTNDLKYSRDFNAVLWYSKNTPTERIVWKRERDLDKPYSINKKSVAGGKVSWSKQVKSNGIATIEYCDRSSGLTDAEGHANYLVQEPINNCIHVFIGCCAPQVSSDRSREIQQCTVRIFQLEKLVEELDKLKKQVDTTNRENVTSLIERGGGADEINRLNNNSQEDLNLINTIRHAIYGVRLEGEGENNTISGILGTLTFEFNSIHETFEIPADLGNTNLSIEKSNKLAYMEQDANSRSQDYPTAKSNYYYLHPLLEWNTDFVTSMKFFDEKVVTAQLIDAITNCFSVSSELGVGGSIGVDFQMQYVQAQLRELVTKIIETDDATVNDCFFSFTNDSYNALLNEVDLARAGLQVMNSTTTNQIPTPEDVLGDLNSLSHGATKEEVQNVVSGSLFSAVSSTNPHDFGHIDYSLQPNLVLGFDTNMSILDQVLTKLTYVIVSTVLQPKVYILLMANLTLMGNEPNFDLMKFIQQFKNMISELIKEIRDQILEYFRSKLEEILQELIKKLAIKLSLEQYQYYINLITHCIECLKLHWKEYDWMQDDVNYADITEITQETSEEC